MIGTVGFYYAALDGGAQIVREVPVIIRHLLHPALVPVPPTRYGEILFGTVSIPGQALMGWYRQISPMIHYFGNPNRATAFDFNQPLTADMFDNGVLRLHGSWLQHGDTNGTEFINGADLDLLTRFLLGAIGSDQIILRTADVHADGVINAVDRSILNSFPQGHFVILGPCKS